MKKSLLYRGFRYPAEIISHVVWLYFRFALSIRDIEDLMASRGIIVTYETICQWTLSSASAMPMNFAGVNHSARTNGISTRWC
ncbi:transposase-like protein [Undibacterium sp. GrIS 1.8]